jgi:hypothetical protein
VRFASRVRTADVVAGDGLENKTYDAFPAEADG